MGSFTRYFYRLDDNDDGDAQTECILFVIMQVRITDTNQTQFEIPTPGLYKKYFFSVQSVNRMGAGPKPVEVSAMSGRNPPTAYPTNVYVARISRFTVSLRWKGVPEADGYRYDG